VGVIEDVVVGVKDGVVLRKDGVVVVIVAEFDKVVELVLLLLLFSIGNDDDNDDSDDDGGDDSSDEDENDDDLLLLVGVKDFNNNGIVDGYDVLDIVVINMFVRELLFSLPIIVEFEFKFEYNKVES